MINGSSICETLTDYLLLDCLGYLATLAAPLNDELPFSKSLCISIFLLHHHQQQQQHMLPVCGASSFFLLSVRHRFKCFRNCLVDASIFST